jgi:hypothetical protein
MKRIRYVAITAAATLCAASVGMVLEAAEKQQPAPSAEVKRHAEVKGYVLPTVVGIESAEMSAAALHELATTEPFERRDARKLTDLAGPAIRVAHDSAEGVAKMNGLSGEARSEAEAATKRLKDARASLERIEKSVKGAEGRMEREEAMKVRDDARRLNSELNSAEKSIERIAGTYNISTKLELGEKAPEEHSK